MRFTGGVAAAIAGYFRKNACVWQDISWELSKLSPELAYLVTAHWFQYIDEPISGRAHDGENANIGFVDVTDQPYPELIKAVKEVTYSMYERRLEN